MALGRPLFRGNTDQDQLQRIFRALGTPTPAMWPSAVELPDWNPKFPKSEPLPLKDIVPALDPVGLELLAAFLIYDPSLRVTASAALEHEYFSKVRLEHQYFPSLFPSRGVSREMRP
eukprot:gnl/TRDRNA2_/TRDRNA2_93235_c0_seq1.p1 gnl/TRDRNA2_/TRDRNA2_93235_c0~~gnl/TRDRNA2_/TRDRNA2_93235_c0_seq1.p1  ORF type:complete len:127 (-),score=16.44 gnl/TRDRNA2_/TRDRNA2_93235_c0_seq1:247-597(-)